MKAIIIDSCDLYWLDVCLLSEITSNFSSLLNYKYWFINPKEYPFQKYWAKSISFCLPFITWFTGAGQAKCIEGDNKNIL